MQLLKKIREINKLKIKFLMKQEYDHTRITLVNQRTNESASFALDDEFLNEETIIKKLDETLLKLQNKY